MAIPAISAIKVSTTNISNSVKPCILARSFWRNAFDKYDWRMLYFTSPIGTVRILLLFFDGILAVNGKQATESGLIKDI